MNITIQEVPGKNRLPVEIKDPEAARSMITLNEIDHNEIMERIREYA